MRVQVESCWSGGDRYYFRCTLPDGTRILLGHNTDGDPWCREYAAQLRDVLERERGVNRNSVRAV